VSGRFPLLLVETLAERLGVSRNTVYSWIV
jgi:transposase